MEFWKINKYHGNVHKGDVKPGKNLVDTKYSPLTPLKQYKIH